MLFDNVLISIILTLIYIIFIFCTHRVVVYKLWTWFHGYVDNVCNTCKCSGICLRFSAGMELIMTKTFSYLR